MGENRRNQTQDKKMGKKPRKTLHFAKAWGATWQAIAMIFGASLDLANIIDNLTFCTDQLFLFWSYDGSKLRVSQEKGT
jgi:hypothetical protein